MKKIQGISLLKNDDFIKAKISTSYSTHRLCHKLNNKKSKLIELQEKVL